MVYRQHQKLRYSNPACISVYSLLRSLPIHFSVCHLVYYDSGTVYLLTFSLPHHSRHFARNWKLIYFGSLTQTLLFSCVAIVLGCKLIQLGLHCLWTVVGHIFISIKCMLLCSATDGCMLLKSFQWLPSAHQLHGQLDKSCNQRLAGAHDIEFQCLLLAVLSLSICLEFEMLCCI